MWTRIAEDGKATGCGLDGSEIESRWGGGRDEIFPTNPDRPWGQSNLLYIAYRIISWGVKQPGRWFNHLPPSRAEV